MTAKVHKDYYKMNFDCMGRGRPRPLYFVYDQQDFINGRAPAFAWDAMDQYGMAIHSLEQTNGI